MLSVAQIIFANLGLIFFESTKYCAMKKFLRIVFFQTDISVRIIHLQMQILKYFAGSLNCTVLVLIK